MLFYPPKIVVTSLGFLTPKMFGNPYDAFENLSDSAQDLLSEQFHSAEFIIILFFLAYSFATAERPQHFAIVLLLVILYRNRPLQPFFTF